MQDDTTNETANISQTELDELLRLAESAARYGITPKLIQIVIVNYARQQTAHSEGWRRFYLDYLAHENQQALDYFLTKEKREAAE